MRKKFKALQPRSFSGFFRRRERAPVMHGSVMRHFCTPAFTPTSSTNPAEACAAVLVGTGLVLLVLLVVHNPEVRRANAGTVVADMVQLHPRGNRANRPAEGNAMGYLMPAFEPKLTVAILGFLSCPLPAIAGLVDFGEEPVLC